MADLVITAAAVVAGANAKRASTVAGEAVAAGQVVYADPATAASRLADNNSATAAARKPKGIALNGAANGQPLAVHTEGDLTVNAVLTPGVAYYLSDAPGGICPVADLLTGEYPTIIGIAKSTTILSVKIVEAGVAL